MSTHDKQQKGYALVNGLNIYYEIHGSGEPLVLLPGGFMTVEAMGEFVPRLAATRRVIGVELQGHGHDSRRTAPPANYGISRCAHARGPVSCQLLSSSGS
jgi:pimeloyl-ACP methyl ester carboxylesterase